MHLADFVPSFPYQIRRVIVAVGPCRSIPFLGDGMNFSAESGTYSSSLSLYRFYL
jgi:hypothetical protein